MPFVKSHEADSFLIKSYAWVTCIRPGHAKAWDARTFPVFQKA
jgi:hypothetical protein